MTQTRFTVNGDVLQLTLPADTPLLWALRDHLGLVATKYGCGMGHCGACTVHLDGVPARACVTPLGAVANREIRTLEGFSPERHPVQQAWLDHCVPQCGYCQAGQLMSAIWLHDREPTPTPAEVAETMNGHICRCGTYPRIAQVLEQLLQNAETDGG